MFLKEQIQKQQLDEATLLRSYQKADKRVFLLDYDGTVTPIVKDPSAAVPSENLIKAIRSLSQDTRNSIWIISGRDQDFLTQQFGYFSNLGLSAEHGCFICKPGSRDWECFASSLSSAWQSDVEAVFQDFANRTKGSWIERKKIALTWHYRNADPDFGELQASECRKKLKDIITEEDEIEIISGKCNVEVRPRNVNKGKIIERLLADIHYDCGSQSFILCLGDDHTDEDMFRALSQYRPDEGHVFTCRVGEPNEQSIARTYLPSPERVIEILMMLAEVCEQG